MRMRHTSRTDPLMEGERKQVSVRISGHYRDRMKEVVQSRRVPDIRSESDIQQDALWLWFHEYDLMTEKDNGSGAREARHRVGAATQESEDAQGLEVGSPT